MSGATIRCQFRVPRRAEPGPDVPRPSRSARMLALAHHISSLVEAEQLRDYAEAARALGLTRARLTQVMNLLLLAPDLQERILRDEANATERALRRVVRESAWDRQRAIIEQLGGELPVLVQPPSMLPNTTPGTMRAIDE